MYKLIVILISPLIACVAGRLDISIAVLKMLYHQQLLLAVTGRLDISIAVVRNVISPVTVIACVARKFDSSVIIGSIKK